MPPSRHFEVRSCGKRCPCAHLVRYSMDSGEPLARATSCGNAGTQYPHSGMGSLGVRQEKDLIAAYRIVAASPESDSGGSHPAPQGLRRRQSGVFPSPAVRAWSRGEGQCQGAVTTLRTSWPRRLGVVGRALLPRRCPVAGHRSDPSSALRETRRGQALKPDRVLAGIPSLDCPVSEAPTIRPLPSRRRTKDHFGVDTCRSPRDHHSCRRTLRRQRACDPARGQGTREHLESGRSRRYLARRPRTSASCCFSEALGDSFSTSSS